MKFISWNVNGIRAVMQNGDIFTFGEPVVLASGGSSEGEGSRDFVAQALKAYGEDVPRLA